MTDEPSEEDGAGSKGRMFDRRQALSAIRALVRMTAIVDAADKRGAATGSELLPDKTGGIAALAGGLEDVCGGILQLNATNPVARIGASGQRGIGPDGTGRLLPVDLRFARAAVLIERTLPAVQPGRAASEAVLDHIHRSIIESGLQCDRASLDHMQLTRELIAEKRGPTATAAYIASLARGPGDAGRSDSHIEKVVRRLRQTPVDGDIPGVPLQYLPDDTDPEVPPEGLLGVLARSEPYDLYPAETVFFGLPGDENLDLRIVFEAMNYDPNLGQRLGQLLEGGSATNVDGQGEPSDDD